MKGGWHCVQELSEDVEITKNSIYRRVKKRGLTAEKVGRSWNPKNDEVDT